MSSYWEIKTITLVAVVAAPLLALFNCPCDASAARGHSGAAVSHQQGCCCQTFNEKEGCCDSEWSPKSNDENTHTKHNCGDSLCTCVVGEMRAVSPTPQRHEVVPQTHACEATPSDSTTGFLAEILAINMFRIPHTVHTPTHLMNCILLC